MPLIHHSRCCLCDHRAPHYSLHSFPSARDHYLFLQWLNILPHHIKNIPHSILRKEYRICESHFDKDDYFPVTGGKKRLKKNCIPKLEPVESCGTPRSKRTGASKGCTPKSISMYKNILPTVERNTDKSPEIEIVTLGFDDITGPLSDNVDVVDTTPNLQSDIADVTNHIGSSSSHNRSDITESDTTPKHARIRISGKRKIETAGSRIIKKRRLAITSDDTVSADILAVKDNLSPPIHQNSSNFVSTVATQGNINQLSESATESDNDPTLAATRSETARKRKIRTTGSRIVKRITASRTIEKTSVSRIIKKRPRCTKMYRSKRDIQADLQKYCYSKLDEVTQAFVDMQLTNQQKKQRGSCWTLRQKAIAALWFKLGPRAYSVLRRLRFALPSKRTITRMIRDICFEPGINERLMQSLEKVVARMADADKICYVTFNEMSLHEGLDYDIKRDIIVGFQDVGNGVRKRVFANHAMVIMARGMQRSWKQVIAYYFMAGGMDRYDIKRMLEEVIENLHKIGLTVLATVCDCAGPNVSAINELKKDTNEIYTRKKEENRNFGFLIGEKEVIPLFDPPHLTTCTRNNFADKDVTFCLDGKWFHASWKDVRELYNLDSVDAIARMCPSLTEHHIDTAKGGKMKVKLAAQVFSQRVSCFMRLLVKYKAFQNCQRALGTAEFLWFFDQLFDSVNGYSEAVEKDKSLYCAIKSDSKHHDFWNKAIKVLSSIEFQATGRKEKFPISTKKWIETIEGFRYLWNVLHNQYGFNCLVPRNVNQDGLKNFFTSICNTGRRNSNPTPYQFIGSVKALLINSCTSIKSPGSNCSEDWTDGILLSLETFINNPDKKEDAPIDEPLLNYDGIMDGLNLEEENGEEDFNFTDIELHDVNNCKNKEMFDPKYEIRQCTRYYLAGYIARRGYEALKYCHCCKLELFTDREKKFSDMIFELRRREILKLKLPKTKFFNLFCRMYDIAKIAVPQICLQVKVRYFLKKIIRRVLKDEFTFSCTQHNVFEVVLNLFTKFYIRVWTSNVNRVLWQKDERFINDEIKKLAQEIVYKRRGRVKKVKALKSRGG